RTEPRRHHSTPPTECAGLAAPVTMKPPKFDYHAPASLDEALALLRRYGGDAKVLAGGQSLMPLLNFRLSRPAALVDLNRIPSLAYIEERDGQVRFGAMTRQRTIEFSPLVARRVPLLREATKWVGHLPIRTRGTIGGSIAHADPSAEYPAVLTALDGEVVARGPKGERVVRARDFFVTYLTPSLEADEILVEVRLPATRRPAGCGARVARLRHPRLRRLPPPPHDGPHPAGAHARAHGRPCLTP